MTPKLGELAYLQKIINIKTDNLIARSSGASD